MHSLYRELDSRVDFLVVYISEAHAKDEWPVGHQFSFCKQPRSLDERIDVCRQFVKEYDFELPICVDSMANRFRDTFAAWPFRYYVLHQGKIIFKAQPDPNTFMYDIGELRDML